MTESIIIALITGGISLVGIVYTQKGQHSVTISEVRNEVRELKSEIKTEVKLIQKDVVDLRKAQDKHNNVIERMYACEKAVDILNVEVTNDKKDIEQLMSEKGKK